MTYIKKYISNKYVNHIDSIEVDNNVYRIGFISNKEIDSNSTELNFNRGFITKFDGNGNIIWEKEYGEGFNFIKAVTCSNGDIIVLAEPRADSGVSFPIAKHQLYRISADGSVIWRNSYDINAVNLAGSDIAKLNDGNIALLIHQNDNVILKVNEDNGEVLLQRNLKGIGNWSIDIRGILAYDNIILLYGNESISNSENLGVCYFFNASSLNLEKKLKLTFQNDQINNSTINQVEYFNGELFLNGQIYIDSSVNFIVKIKATTLNNKTLVDIKCLNRGFSFFLNNQFIYLYSKSRGNDLIVKLTRSFEIIWTKAFDASSLLATPKIINDLITFSSWDRILAALNLDFESCKTIDINRDSFTDYSLNLDFELDNYNLIDTNFNALGPIGLFRVEDVVSSFEEVCPPTVSEVLITETTSLQSPNFYLQSVGSKGIESTKGMHLRWIFSGVLGEKHLPKRDYAANTHNFNKPNDVVKVYRTKYQKVQFTLNLFERPRVVDDTNRLWIYRFADNREFYVYFRNTTKYSQVRAAIDPLSNPSGFIQSYGNELIEVENKKELFFATELKATNTSSSSSVQTESLSVSENTLLALKGISNRLTFTSSELNAMRLVCENGRSIRFKPSNCQVSEIHFEFYADFIASVNKGSGWQPMGDYGLTLDNNLAYSLLEPTSGLVHGHWQRYNDDAYVNIDNYKTKWDRPTEPWDRDIKQIVNNYIQLSNVASNPTAIESVPFEKDDDDPLEISNLDQLNFAAYDYHIARMLGLGVLDVDTTIFEDTYVYVAEYTTFGDLEDGLGKREVHHLSMGLPTSINDERLPIPVDIKEIVPGAFFGNEGEPVNLTDDDGYTHNGESRYVTLFAKNQPADLIGTPFYQTPNEFALEKFTHPVYAGVEYRNVPVGQTDGNVWEKPELPKDIQYLNAVPTGEDAHPETRMLQVPENGKPLYVHKQDRSGLHYYSSYGINWFSRATSSEVIRPIQTHLQPKNPLLPPSNINPLLIRKESPLLLTSEEEQGRLSAIDNPNHGDENHVHIDETLIRITFDYHTYQDMITRKVPLDSLLSNNDILTDVQSIYPDNEEILAEEVDIFFRDQVPNNVSGKALLVTDHPSSNVLSNIQTVDYERSSTGQTNPTTNIFEPEIISPVLTPGTEDNYIGGSFVLGNQQHIIHSVVQGTDGPIFSVYKKEISDALINDIPSADADNLQPIEITGDGFFMAVENMQNASSWGTPNPLPLTVNVAANNQIHREIIEIIDDYGNVERQVEKSRGIWSDPNSGALVESIDRDGNVSANHTGIYRVTFRGVQLPQHPQYNANGVSVEWFRGFARVFTEGSVQGGIARKTRKILPVMKIQNIGTSNDLVVYINDAGFSSDSGYDAIQTGNNISVNFYPSYKVYLYNDNSYGLNEDTLLPDQGEGTRYSIFGLRSRDLQLPQNTIDKHKSKISVPSLMFAQEMIAALPPEQPEGALYATRPDFFGRSTYTLTTKYQHQPHGVLFYRANDEALLNALYEKSTVIEIRETLKVLGGNEEAYFTNRWQNFLNFDEIKGDGDFKEYPPENVEENPENRFKFPNPDKRALFIYANEVISSLNNHPVNPANPQIVLFNVDVDASNTDVGNILIGDGRLFGFAKAAIYNAFVPLTEVPIIYQHIEGEDYKPVNEKQVIRDRNGYLLSPTHEDFKMAPMMKSISTSPHETQFVDFNLDGTSNNIYFYGVREVSSQMKMGDYSPFLGPIKLVNTNAPETPEAKRIMPVFENIVLGTPPSIQLEINAYPEVQNIKKLTIYRAFNKLDAQSVRKMQMVKVIDLESEGIINDAIWKVYDTFDDLIEVPYGDGLFYRVTVSREVEYADKEGNVIIEHQPSQASKIVATMVVEVANPPAPILDFVSDPLSINGKELPNVILQWEKTCYNGKYHIYKMNSQGNWVKIDEVRSNHDTIALPLVDTNLSPELLPLQVRNSENKPIYHHFKAVAENISGMLSTEEYILTILQNINEIGGIGSMIIGDTFIVN